jgi:hypothetical protein
LLSLSIDWSTIAAVQVNAVHELDGKLIQVQELPTVKERKAAIKKCMYAERWGRKEDPHVIWLDANQRFEHQKRRSSRGSVASYEYKDEPGDEETLLVYPMEEEEKVVLSSRTDRM